MRGQRRTAQLVGAAVTMGALVLALAGCATSSPAGLGAASASPASTATATPHAGSVGSSLGDPALPTPGTRTPTPTPAARTPTPPAAPTRTPEPTPTRKPAADTALGLLGTLPVKGRAPKTGYDRPVVFGAAWKDVDRNGCDTRNDLLRRDLSRVVIKAGTHGCVVLAGTLRSPYTGKKIPFVRGVGTSNAVQIDHVVALMDAWQSGAQKLDLSRREQLANDPLNLLAVDGRSNAQKGAGNAATWLPASKGYRCAYVARQITVKAKYHLWVTAPERDAMERILGSCPAQKTAASGTIVLMPDAVGTSPKKSEPPVEKPTKKTSSHTSPARPPVVHPGAFCTPQGARGVTVKGTPMRCTTTATDSRARWRSAS